MNLKLTLELHLKWLKGEKDGCRANLRDADLRGANLRDADLRGANLRDANLRDADLRGADLCGANLRGADLRDADLRDANLCDANLCGANLRGANLRDADLRDADLRGANLCDANLCDANLWSTIGNKSQVKSLQIETFDITYTKTHIQIGCQRYSIEEWRSFDDVRISKMEHQALDLWKKWKETIFKIIEMSPAK